MDLKKIKLQLINQLMQTDDIELLQTIQQILSLNSSNPNPEQQIMSPNDPFEKPHIPSKNNLDEAAQEVQDSIDEVFNP